MFHRNEKIISDPSHNLRKTKCRFLTRQDKKVEGMFFICRTSKTNENLKLIIPCTALIDVFTISLLYFPHYTANKTWSLNP